MDAKEWNISGAWVGISRYLVVGGFLMIMVIPRIGNAAACDAAAGYPCTFQIENQEIQKVPTYFKFQSRISQAKIPVGDVVFDSVIVNLKKGNNVLCSETFSRVKVRDSVLNLEIGRGMADSCGELESIVAANNDLKFQICIGDQSNCLKPVDLATVPYAVKASYAATAQKAHAANTAVQCNYAHRLTADRNLFVNQQIGKGYYDFHTPSDTTFLEWYDAQSVDYQDGGFIQWAPLGASKNLHVCAQDPGSDNPVPLEEFLIHSTKTQMMGVAVIEGSEASDGMTGVKGLQIKRSGLGVTGKADFYDDVAIGGEPETDNRQCDIYHKLDVYGTSDFRADVTVDAAAVTIVNGPASFYGETLFDNKTTHNKEVVFNENVTMGPSKDSRTLLRYHKLEARGESVFYERVRVLNNESNALQDGYYDFHVEGDAAFDDKVIFKGETTFSKASHTYFKGSVEFDGPITMPGDFYATPGPDSVESDHIKENAVNGYHIDQHSVENDQLGLNAVHSGNIKNGEVKTEDIAPGAVTNQKLGLAWAFGKATFTGEANTEDIGGVNSVCFLTGIYPPDVTFPSWGNVVVGQGSSSDASGVERDMFCKVHSREDGKWLVTGQVATCSYVCLGKG